MLQAKSTFGFAPNLLEQFQKRDCTPDKSAHGDSWLNRQHGDRSSAVSQQAVREVPAKPVAINQSAPNCWSDYLLEVGEQFREVRTSLGISLRELHYQTLVPIAHIEALETGAVEQLPTAVYVRGFVRKIGKALGLDGDGLAESLPQQDYLKTVLPSWQRLPASKSSPISLSRLPLSMGYFTLMLMSTFWLLRQENAIQTQLEPSEISEVQPDLSAK
jgi:hypothetical protein